MTPLEARTVPTRGAPNSNGNRHGRPFTLRLETAQEDTFRRELARLELLPFNERPREVFGWDAGGGAGRRRASLGWFLVWAGLKYCEQLAAGHKPGDVGAGKTGRAARRATRSTRRKGKTRTRPRAAKRSKSKKGGRR